MSDLGIGYIIAELFGPLGAIGGVLCILLLFFIDAVIFPTVPELFTVLVFMQGYGLTPPAWRPVAAAIAVGEVAGLLTILDSHGSRAGAATEDHHGHRDFLVCRDEKMTW